MRSINPFDTSRSPIKTSNIGGLFLVLGSVVCVLGAKGMIPDFFVWPGILLFFLGWVTIVFAGLVILIRAIRRRGTKL